MKNNYEAYKRRLFTSGLSTDQYGAYRRGYYDGVSDATPPGSLISPDIDQKKITRRQVNAELSALAAAVGGGIVYGYGLIKNMDLDIPTGIHLGEKRDPIIVHNEAFYQDYIPGDEGTRGFSRLFNPTTLSQVSDNIGPDANCVLSIEPGDEQGQETAIPQVIFNNGTSLKVPYLLRLHCDDQPLIPLDCYPTGDREFETVTFQVEQIRGEPEKSNEDTTRRVSFKPDYSIERFEHRDGDLVVFKETQALFPDRLQSSIDPLFTRVPYFQTCYLRDNKWSLNGKLYTISRNGSPVIGESLGYLDQDDCYYHMLALWGEFIYEAAMDTEGEARNSLGSFLEVFTQIQKAILAEQDNPTGPRVASTGITLGSHQEIFYELDTIFKPYRDPSLDRYLFDDSREEFGRILATMMQDPDRIFDLQDHGNTQTKQNLAQLCGEIWNVVYEHLAASDNVDQILPNIFPDSQSQIIFNRWSKRIY